MDLTALILEFAEKNNFITGICGCEPFDYLRERLSQVQTPFNRYGIKERIDPKLTMPGCKSIIVIGMGYGKQFNFEEDSKPRGVLSQLAVGVDYHILIKQLLEKLECFLRGYVDFSSMIFADTGPLVERELLKRAGLGWQGKNGLIYSNKFGSYFCAGYMLTDINLRTTEKELPSLCGGCELCEVSCPGAALCGGNHDYSMCASYLTQKKGELTDAEKKIIGVKLYGCDICQEVCPHNTGAVQVSGGEITDIESARPELSGFLALSDMEFTEKYKRTVFFWRGRKVLMRNAAIALENWKAYRGL